MTRFAFLLSFVAVLALLGPATVGAAAAPVPAEATTALEYDIPCC